MIEQPLLQQFANQLGVTLSQQQLVPTAIGSI